MPHSGKIVPTITEAYANVVGAQARVGATQKLFPSSTEKKESCCMSKKFYYFKTKHISLPKYASSTVAKDTKTSEIPPVGFIGGLYKVHLVMCSKLTELQAKNVN